VGRQETVDHSKKGKKKTKGGGKEERKKPPGEATGSGERPLKIYKAASRIAPPATKIVALARLDKELGDNSWDDHK